MIENEIKEQTHDLIVTHSAAAKIFELKTEENNPHLKLRIYVTGGGCSGFQYGFSFEETANADDFILKKTVDSQYLPSEILENLDHLAPTPFIEILVDAMSMQYLNQAKIDYRKDLRGEQFIITNNPNVKTTCGCGSSFSAD